MIVDTSALVAVIRDEIGRQPITKALIDEFGLIPAPALVEFRRVVATEGNRSDPVAESFLEEILASNLSVEPFTPEDAMLASAANPLFGTGNGRGGTLNMLDLMVYGMARRMERPILCTGKDFAATDIAIHPASRGW